VGLPAARSRPLTSESASPARIGFDPPKGGDDALAGDAGGVAEGFDELDVLPGPEVVILTNMSPL
jgi:hypothetical protein